MALTPGSSLSQDTGFRLHNQWLVLPNALVLPRVDKHMCECGVQNTNNPTTQHNHHNNQASIPSVPILFVRVTFYDGPQLAAKDRSCPASERATTAAWQHEQPSIAQALAVYTHHSAPRRQTMARAGEWVRNDVHDQVPEEPTLPRRQALSTFLWTSKMCLPPGCGPGVLATPRPRIGDCELSWWAPDSNVRVGA